MSWGSLQDRYVPYEILSDESSSSFSSISSSTSSSPSIVLDHMPVPINTDSIHCTNESSWGRFALDDTAWDDDKAPVVQLRNLKEVLFNELEFCGFLTDRLIGIGSSFLAKSPENGLYVLNKYVMRNMSLSNITMLYFHRYLRYIDLSYNYISNLSPLSGVPYLMYLNMAHNRVTVILNFQPPWYLTYVNLSYNYISEMHDISSFWSIIHLDLSHNAIEVITGLQNLKYLKYLNLSYNLIECIENLDKLNIQQLNLEGNCITSFKSAIPGYSINTLPHLQEIYLGYNKISSLEFFKDGYSLRIIDLRFNKISDLLELSNFNGFIDEIDLRGNGCTKWPNYKVVLLFSIPSIQRIDGVSVDTSEKIVATTLFASPVNLTAARTVTKLTLLEQLNTPTIDLHVLPYDQASPPLIILTGPSAIKKIPLAIHVVQTISEKIKYCPWYTTKVLGDSELERQCYISASREEFNDMSRRGEFLAIQELLGNSYGFHHNQISLLILEKKIGITQMDLHATMQLCKRYSNSKPILVLTKSERLHRNWIEEKFNVYMCVKDSMDYLNKENQSNAHSSVGGDDKSVADIIHVSDLSMPETFLLKDEIEVEEKKFIKFQGEEEFNRSHTKLFDSTFTSKLDQETDLRVILDKGFNAVVDDDHSKRRRHQAKLLHRRSTLINRELFTPDILSESISSEETLLDQLLMETQKPEYLKELYTDLVIKTRTIYFEHHVNNPGFFSLVLLLDDYNKAFNNLIHFIYKSYASYPTEKPKIYTEVEHFSQVTVPTMVNTIIEEIKQSLSTSKLQTKTWLRTYGVTSFEKLMPTQMAHDSKKRND
ncbi:Leucine-rich repeat and guanylate kinase domain-containing protein [Dufourea novaeangliae]|uniref:Leucine-rich repeat and guanylate kinase domain-containing protein n=1 Tax=Dufourea novaeangliae TaxID=178035 RepID=A0A154PFE6_DUFNO|nr:Leucine-rich repeat and guanylate kinase domain-containing protein [Dufourea novaeangliae]